MNNELSNIEKDTKLEKRLGAEVINNKYFVTGLGTITYNGKEYRFDDFIKKVESSIKNGDCSVKYDDGTHRFYLIRKNGYSGNCKAAEIDINEKDMEDYVFGKFTKDTLKLHDLYLASEMKNEIVSKEKTVEERKDEIIEKANNREELTPLEARVYIDYLHDLNKENAKTAAKEAGKIVVAGGTPIVGGTTMTAAMIAKVVGGAATVSLGTGLFVSIGLGIVTCFATYLAEETIRLLVATIRNDENYELFNLLDVCQKSFEELKNKIEDIKVNRTKQKYLNQLHNVDKIVEADAVVVEDGDTKPLELKDKILEQIDGLVNKMAYINPKDRTNMLNNAQELLETYVTRSRNILNQDENIINMQADNIVDLRIDMCKEIAKLEIELNEIRAKDKKHETLSSEGKMLSNKIEAIESKNTEPIEVEVEEIRDDWKAAEVREMLSDDPKPIKTDYEVLDYDDGGIKLA
jgi:hypothetical protein